MLQDRQGICVGCHTCHFETCFGCKQDFDCARDSLLQMLCEKRGDVIRREAILDKFWNTEDDYFASRSLDVFVTRLRKFLSEDESVTIKTVKGVGLILIEN